jgi:Tfp pilus assembly protein PilF
MFYLGTMYLEARDIKSAEPLFEEVLKLAPDHYKSHNYMGMISMARGNVEEAKKWFSQALEIYPNDSVAAANLKWAESVEVAQPEKQ